jgi:hypothetical protein
MRRCVNTGLLALVLMVLLSACGCLKKQVRLNPSPSVPAATAAAAISHDKNGNTLVGALGLLGMDSATGRRSNQAGPTGSELQLRRGVEVPNYIQDLRNICNGRGQRHGGLAEGTRSASPIGFGIAAQAKGTCRKKEDRARGPSCVRLKKRLVPILHSDSAHPAKAVTWHMERAAFHRDGPVQQVRVSKLTSGGNYNPATRGRRFLRGGLLAARGMLTGGIQKPPDCAQQAVETVQRY